LSFIASQEINNIVDLVNNGLLEATVKKMGIQKQHWQPKMQTLFERIVLFLFCVEEGSIKNV
jgi:hypothetical protein